jgi:hypothetical protein
MLKQKELLSAVIALLKTKYPVATTKYYTDEIVEGFIQPCFFVKLIKTRNTETKNVNSNSIAIILTYFADVSVNKQLAFLDAEDDINLIFGVGIQVGTRYLHIKNISAERIGEEQDILQVTISIDYLDSTGYDPNAGYDIMQNLNQNVVNKY